MMPNKLAAPNPAIASQLHGGRHWRGIGEPERYPTFRIMCKIIIPFLVLSSISSLSLAQEQAIPAIRILPEDVVQDSIRQFQRSTNKFRVMWTYTEAGAKKMLAFYKAHDGQEVIKRIGSFEIRGRIVPRASYPPGWVNDEGWLKSRTDKFYEVSEEDAKKIIAGFKSG